jgi:DNA-binding MarR family transcriptional regulator
MSGLHEAGFADVLPAHLGVFQFPGPDGLHPGVLASRALASKQSMNHLLHQLESTGYLVRESNPEDRRSRVVRLTERGWAVDAVIRQTTSRLDAQWRDSLGDDVYGRLADALQQLHEALDRQASPQ